MKDGTFCHSRLHRHMMRYFETDSTQTTEVGVKKKEQIHVRDPPVSFSWPSSVVYNKLYKQLFVLIIFSGTAL